MPAKRSKSNATKRKARTMADLNDAEIKPYEEIRADLIRAYRDAGAKMPRLPKRPRGLDRRLSASRARKLRALGPPTGEYSEAMNDMYFAITTSILDELAAIDRDSDWYELLSPARRAVILAYIFESDVNNGGFDQYYLNSSGDGAAQAPGALRTLGLARIAKLVEKANGMFKGGPARSREARLAAMDALPENARRVWEKLTNQFFDRKMPANDIMGATMRFVIRNEAEFFRTA